MKKLLTICIWLFSLSASAQEQGMKFFQGSWEEVKAEAAKRDKPIFMDAYASWCGPCKRMAADVFTRDDVGEYYNTNFINYKLDMEKGEGPELARQYNVRAYPTLLYFDNKGELIHRSIGGKSPQNFITLGQEALDVEKQLYARLEQYKNGKRDTAFLRELAMDAGNESDQLEQEILAEYWKRLDKSDFIKPHNWELFVYYDKTISSPAYVHIQDNRKAFDETYGQQDVERALLSKAAYTMEMAAQTKNEKLFMEGKKIMEESTNEEASEYGSYAEIYFYRAMKDWKKYITAGDKYFEKYAEGDAEKLNKLAWDVYTSGTDDEQLINKAIHWAKASVEASREYYNLDTYAALLYAGKQYKEAEKMALESIELAKTNNEDYQSTRELLEKIRKEIE